MGSGTGQATGDLFRISKNVLCIEPGSDLLKIAKEKFPNLTFINTKFEEFNSDEKFDLVFAATSWHWVDPEIGNKKAHKILKDSGYLAVLRNYHIEMNSQAFHIQAQWIYNKYSNRTARLSSRQMIEDQAKSIENKYFHLAKHVEYPWHQTYTVNDYIALRNTYSDHRLMKDSDRQQFEQELREFANKKFDGLVTKNYIAALFIGEKKFPT